MTMSEIIDDAVRHEAARVFDDPYRGDPTKGGRFDPGLIDKAPDWICPCGCRAAGGWLVCPHCEKPRDPAA